MYIWSAKSNSSILGLYLLKMCKKQSVKAQCSYLKREEKIELKNWHNHFALFGQSLIISKKTAQIQLMRSAKRFQTPSKLLCHECANRKRSLFFQLFCQPDTKSFVFFNLRHYLISRSLRQAPQNWLCACIYAFFYSLCVFYCCLFKK